MLTFLFIIFVLMPLLNILAGLIYFVICANR